jgi:pSer/pThr/pTyr-binding forkhead associated (FHA) protein
MSFKLSVRQGPRPNLVFELDKPSYMIGREAGNDIVIEDPQVSRRHAQLTRQGNSYLIEDVGSTNGTYVNGKRVMAPTLLSNGDMVGLADTVIIAVQVPLTSGEDATVVSDAASYAPPTVPAFTPLPAQAQPAPRPPAYTPPVQSQPAPQNQPALQGPAYVPPLVQAQPVYTPPIQAQPAAQVPAYSAPQYAPPPQYAAPQYAAPQTAAPSYTPPPADYAESNPADDKRRTILIGLGCLGLLLVVMLVAFVAWSFIDCRSFSSVFQFLFPPFSCT